MIRYQILSAISYYYSKHIAELGNENKETELGNENNKTELGNENNKTEFGNENKTELGNENKETELGNENNKTELGNENKETELGNENKETELGNENKETELGNENKETELGNENIKTGLGNEIKKTYDKLCNDPYPFISKKAIEIRNVTPFSTELIQDYMSLILSPIYEILKSPEKQMSRYVIHKVNDNCIKRKPKKIQFPENSLGIISIYTHSYEITSNFVLLPNDNFGFCDKKGNINIKSWGNNYIDCKNISNCIIKRIYYIDNYSYPLIITLNEKNQCIIYSYEGFIIRAAFNLNVTNNENLIIEADSIGKTMLLYEKNSTHLTIYDLDMQEKLETQIDFGEIISSSYVTSDIICVCSRSQLETFDFRKGDRTILHKFDINEVKNNPFDFKIFNCSDGKLSFVVCYENGIYLYEKVGNNKETSSLVYHKETKIVTFKVHDKAQICAFSVSGCNDLVCIDLLQRKQKTFNCLPKSFLKDRPFNTISQIIFHHSKLLLNVLNGVNEIITIGEIHMDEANSKNSQFWMNPKF